MSAREEFTSELRRHRLRGPDATVSGLSARSGLGTAFVARVFEGDALPKEPPTVALLEAMDVSDRDRQHMLILRERALREMLNAEPPTPKRTPAERPAPDWRVPVPAAGEPDPVMFSTVREFVAGLEDVRVWAGEPSLRRLEERSARLHQQRPTAYGRVLRRSTISDMLNASALPRMEKVRHFLQICGVRDIDAWVYTWRRVRAMEKAAARRAA